MSCYFFFPSYSCLNHSHPKPATLQITPGTPAVSPAQPSCFHSHVFIFILRSHALWLHTQIPHAPTARRNVKFEQAACTQAGWQHGQGYAHKLARPWDSQGLLGQPNVLQGNCLQSSTSPTPTGHSWTFPHVTNPIPPPGFAEALSEQEHSKAPTSEQAAAPWAEAAPISLPQERFPSRLAVSDTRPSCDTSHRTLKDEASHFPGFHPYLHSASWSPSEEAEADRHTAWPERGF